MYCCLTDDIHFKIIVYYPFRQLTIPNRRNSTAYSFLHVAAKLDLELFDMKVYLKTIGNNAEMIVRVDSDQLALTYFWGTYRMNNNLGHRAST